MSERHFRGITGVQEQLISYWYGLAARRGQGCPQRSDLSVGVLRTQLAHLSMLEIDTAGTRRFRIVGSRLRDILGMDARGKSLKALPSRFAEMWALGLDVALERRAPVGGLVSAGTEGKQHAWLRLPVEDAGGRLSLVLCHDQLLLPDRNESVVPLSIPNGLAPIAA